MSPWLVMTTISSMSCQHVAKVLSFRRKCNLSHFTFAFANCQRTLGNPRDRQSLASMNAILDEVLWEGDRIVVLIHTGIIAYRGKKRYSTTIPCQCHVAACQRHGTFRNLTHSPSQPQTENVCMLMFAYGRWSSEEKKKKADTYIRPKKLKGLTNLFVSFNISGSS